MNARGAASVVVCGEFLNAVEIRHELGLAPAAAAAEIALAAYRRWDGDLFAHLDGVCALALHDAARRTLAGVDPNTLTVLQAVEIGGDVLVASEAKARIAATAAPVDADLYTLTFGSALDPDVRRAYAESVLLSARLAERGFMDSAGVRSLWEAHLRGEDHTVALGQVMNLELWQRFFVDGDAIPAKRRC